MDSKQKCTNNPSDLYFCFYLKTQMKILHGVFPYNLCEGFGFEASKLGTASSVLESVMYLLYLDTIICDKGEKLFFFPLLLLQKESLLLMEFLGSLFNAVNCTTNNTFRKYFWFCIYISISKY